ncbi:PAS domain S-box protein [Ramlibacter albus]|uniref:PAS domain S-box protein n=1 Tax=Ramlibacter albus TaxID=2079448 RepID=A0A923MAV5_9BURK|nr:PAS domain S-box protein [Ramlibacter albus]MBC5765958.1 PAS domain S-box protein [Ramlibacter albus]
MHAPLPPAPTLRMLLARLVAAALLPVMLGAAALTWWHHGHEKREAMETMTLAARAISATLDERFIRARLQLDAPRAFIALEPGPLNEMLARQGLPAGWVATIVNDSGHVVTRAPDGDDTAGRDYVWPRGMRGDSGVVETETGATAYSRSNWTGWSVVLEAPDESLYRYVRGLLLWTTGGLLVLVLSSLWLVKRLAARILDSMATLAADARQAAIGLPMDVPPLAFREANEFAALLDAAAREVHQSTMALERSERQLRAVLDTAMDAVVVADNAGRIVLFNDEAERMFRTTRTFMMGQPLENLMPERYRDMHAQMVRRFVREPGNARAMGRHRLVFGMRSDGEEFPIEASISSARADGEQWLTVIMRDVTRRQIEQAAHESTQLPPLRLIREMEPVPSHTIPPK